MWGKRILIFRLIIIHEGEKSSYSLATLLIGLVLVEASLYKNMFVLFQIINLEVGENYSSPF